MQKTIRSPFYFLLIVTLAVSVMANARQRRVLFVGNSYIYSNNLPDMLKQLADSVGDTLVVDQVTPGGYTLEQHSTNATTIAKIQSAQWDVVILQEQSQRPSFSPSQVASDTYPYAKKLDSIIRDNNSCTETMFYMTWGRENGDASNCPFYPPICTYEGMQARLRESYIEMAKDNNAVVAPVGAAWKLVRDSLSSINLYSPDESHPSVHGTYLAACVFYASIFHRSPHGNAYKSTLSASDAERLQYYAGKVTMDSLDKWQQHGNYVYASFEHSIVNANTRSFQNNSLYATNYSWDFGDMNTGSQPNPTHTYAQNGIYNVVLNASNSCFSELKKDTVNIGSVSVPGREIKVSTVFVQNRANGEVAISISDGYDQLSIYATNGALVKRYDLSGAKEVVTCTLIPGVYMYELSGSNSLSRDKFVAY